MKLVKDVEKDFKHSEKVSEKRPKKLLLKLLDG